MTDTIAGWTALRADESRHTLRRDAGDFARWCRQDIDLLDQVTSSVDGSETPRPLPAPSRASAGCRGHRRRMTGAIYRHNIEI
ncbi:hypothetical protein OH799_05515 [Nocardia sp. NBC_00881]|uniref:hypothetical protein n=1 Tax=Nocardia sp. NBC_00881 TaxID=2975995 RepID=UPI003864D9DB|nr:hypothetical protein OH799_05515 [Nocardia sp. NBC_00881]